MKGCNTAVFTAHYDNSLIQDLICCRDRERRVLTQCVRVCLKQGQSSYLHRSREGWVTCCIRSAGVAAISELIDEVPCKDGGLVLVLPPIQGVGAVDDGSNVVLKQLDDFRVGEEVPSSHGAAPLNILEEAVLEVPVVIQGQYELDAGLACVVDDFVEGCEGLFIILSCRHRVVESEGSFLCVGDKQFLVCLIPMCLQCQIEEAC